LPASAFGDPSNVSNFGVAVIIRWGIPLRSAAGALTKRDGFDYNSATDKRVNGRDLWSTRVTAAWQPSSDFKANFVWEHFNENDDPSRTGRQLCHTDPGPSMVGGRDISLDLLTRGVLTQSCKPGSLYDNDAFGVPKGFSLPYINAAATALLHVLRSDGMDAVGEEPLFQAPARPSPPVRHVSGASGRMCA
jgi:hypothetical protein